MAYEHKPMARQRVRYNSDNDDNPLIYQLVLPAEGKVTPTSATIAIYRDGTTTAVLAATAMTVSGTTLTYSVDTTTVATWPSGSQFRADIVVTYNTKTYDRHIRFDVVPYIFDMSIGADQLIANDDGLRGMLHDGDESFKSIIVASNAFLQARLEAKVRGDTRILQEMLVDSTGLATAQIFYILSRIWREKNAPEKADRLEQDSNELFDSVLAAARIDTGLSGEEPSEIGGIQPMRFET